MKELRFASENDAWLDWWARRSPQVRAYYQTIRLPCVFWKAWKRVRDTELPPWD